MPITYSLSDADADIQVEINGVVTPADVEQYVHNLMQKFETLSGKRALIVIDSVRPQGFGYTAMRAMAGKIKHFEPILNGSRTAVIAASSIAFGLARMYLLTRSPPYEMLVFRDRNAGLLWLNNKSG